MLIHVDMLDNKFIQSVLAASIMDRNFMEKLSADAKKAGGGSQLFDRTITGLKYFSGFIAKVQHNFLWNDFMLTRKMLIRQQIELEVFTAYLPEHQDNKRNRITEPEKIFRFISFLKKYLEQRTQYRYRIVYNALLHEEAMFVLKQYSDKNAALPIVKKQAQKILIASQPVICGTFRHVLMNVPPQSLGKYLKENKTRMMRRRRSYSYWYDPHSISFRILEMPLIMRRVLAAIDNKRKVRDIIKYFSATIHPTDIKLVLEHLLSNRMISLN